jgi:hypothetical protein
MCFSFVPFGDWVEKRRVVETYKKGIPIHCFFYLFWHVHLFVSNLYVTAQVPGVILLTTYWRNDLIGLYTGMGLGYAACVVLYGYIVLTRCALFPT